MIILKLHNLAITCLVSFYVGFFKNVSHFQSTGVTPFILKLRGNLSAACGTVWSRFGGVSVQQVVLWWVCVGIVWL